MKFKLMVVVLLLNGLVACQSESRKPMVPGGNQVVENPTPTPSPTPSPSPSPVETPTPAPNPIPVPNSIPTPSPDASPIPVEGSIESDSTINPENDNDVKIELVDGNGANLYQVRMIWRFDQSIQGKVNIKRTDRTEKKLPYFILNKDLSEKTYLDSELLENGHEYQYEIFHQVSEKILVSKTIMIPKDLVFRKGENYIDQYMNAKDLENNTYKFKGHRVYFEDQAVVYTNGKSVYLESDVIAFSKATVITAPKTNNNSYYQSQNLQTGNIKINAVNFAHVSDNKKIQRPTLILNTHSQNGLDGNKGVDAEQSNYMLQNLSDCKVTRGASGGNGSDSMSAGSIEFKISNGEKLKKLNALIVWYANSGLSGKGGDPGKSVLRHYCAKRSDRPNQCELAIYCPTYSEQTKGSDGFRGESAKNICINFGDESLGCEYQLPSNGYSDGISFDEISCPFGYDSEKKELQSNKCLKNYKWEKAFSSSR